MTGTGAEGPGVHSDETAESLGLINRPAQYIVQVWNGQRWAKVRGPEGGPWRTQGRAQRIADGRELSDRRTSSTEGMPHRVVRV